MSSRPSRPLAVLGAGMTGLAAGRAAGAPVYEQADSPGGICSSYYLRPGSTERLAEAPADGEAYRFELGGGHWIFGGDREALALIEQLAPVRRYRRRAGVIVDDPATLVPYPLQNHLHALDPVVAEIALDEITAAATSRAPADELTMRQWLGRSFGPTLATLFFDPFNRRYTDGLYDEVAPQDGYKSPIDLHAVTAGARPSTSGDGRDAGYNATFAYPERGLDELARRLADGVDVSYGAEVVGLDTTAGVLQLADGREVPFGALISTLPLDRAVAMAGLDLDGPADPYTSVLVLNIGAERGDACPEEHWVYDPGAVSGFHRVGFYDNVDPSFLPVSARGGVRARARTAIYVERAYRAGSRPGLDELERVASDTVIELQARGWIGATDVVDPTWIEVAYTWTRPGSTWRDQALDQLSDLGVHQVGRYARWEFQGIADSIRDGLRAGTALAAR